jgi:acetyl-CoA C-acetyltransferase
MSIPHVESLEALLASMEIRCYMERNGLSEREIASVVVKNLGNVGKQITVEDILASQQLSGAIRKSLRAPARDAAVTLILTSEDRAKRLKGNPIFVRGIGWCSNKGHMASRDLGLAAETKWAARQAYKMAQIIRPENEIDLAEVNDWYAHRELMHCEALGLCGAKDIASCINDGTFEKNGKIPVNRSGGLLGRGNPIGGAGLLSVARVFRQLRGKAASQQIPGARFGLAHGWSGLPAATAGVAVLSNW